MRRTRLFGVDAMEKNQMCQDRAGKDWPCGHQATEKLTAALDGQSVQCSMWSRACSAGVSASIA